MKTIFILSLLTMVISCSKTQFGGTEEAFFKKVNPVSEVVSDPVQASKIVEQFKQVSQKKVDFLWVIDDSGSMANEQASLGLHFNSFIQNFVLTSVDFKMGITTTDARPERRGLMVPGSDTKLTSAAAKSDPAKFMSDFKNLINVGITGSGIERGLDTTQGFMERYASTFLRPDAYLVVIIVSDEEDQSPAQPSEYVNFLKSLKSSPGLVKIYSIADTQSINSGSGIIAGSARYEEASILTGGEVANIMGDFAPMLTSLSDSIMNVLDSFALSDQPKSGTLKVYVNNKLVTGYSYDPVSLSIKFNDNSLPPVGATIKVVYEKESDGLIAQSH